MTSALQDSKPRSPFPPIADYAFLSDCHVTALVAPSGAVEWMCVPRVDGASIFGAMLDRDAGTFRLGPVDVAVPAARRYLPGTMVVETTWMTRSGWAVVRDALLMGPWHHDRTHESSHRRPPTDYDAEHVLLRLVECAQGSVEINLNCEPMFDYGSKSPTWEWVDDDYHQAVARAKGVDDLEVHLRTDLRVGFEGRRCEARTLLKEGEGCYAALTWVSDHEEALPRDFEDAGRRLDKTKEYWRQWLDRGEFPDHPWRSYLQRSALTLKGLTYAPTGALTAAGTTSLPEAPGGARNWDYRYSWIRDSTFGLWGLYTLGFDYEANDFFYFLADACGGGDRPLQVMYGVEGEARLEEKTLDHLSGYEDSRPVRIGNGAYNQEQHDVWGAFLDSVYIHTKSRDYFPEQLWPMLSRQVETALERWREPDRGIWEVRGEPKHFTFSKVACWVAADRGARLARLREDGEMADRWFAAAEEIKGDILANALDDRGVFTQHYDTKALDASNLLMPLLRFLPPGDDRIRNTVLAIADELTEGGFVLRYRPEETDDGLGGGSEGTFLICSFWLVSALVEIGEYARGRDLCEKLLAHSSDLKLYAEELDPKTGRHLGNFPQAFTHLALINAVVHVIRSEGAGDPTAFAPVRLTA
ncbi:MAG TPA: glycoside hydrolase family 15 protein [Thermoleophilaceae bacterium]|nr:glycoside hydrolase family 15 protein [Thermoleophilaceae bacterium]